MKCAGSWCLLLVLALALAPRADACMCIPSQKGTRAEQVLEALNDHGVVFVARLRSTTLTPHKEYAGIYHEDAVFVVIEVLKGPLLLGQPVRVVQEVGHDSCTTSSTNNPPWLGEFVTPSTGKTEPVFEPEKVSRDWLIYSNDPGPFELDSCTLTRPLNFGGDKDLKILRDFVRKPPKHPLQPK